MSIPYYFDDSLIADIKSLSKKYFPIIKDIREHLHQYPELSFQEEKTSQFIAEQLSLRNIEFTKGWAGHGLVAEIRSDIANVNTVALRADIDALPIHELSDVAYQSQNEGIMHACGHDVHTACVLGACFILNDLKSKLPYNVRVLFQPGEEKLPGGASMMINEGVLENPQPMSIMGQHVYPELKVGQVGIRSGLYMASADEIYIKAKGKGGHAAMPHNCIDPILMSAHLITALQSVVSRRSPINVPTVLTIGKINSVGGATNIIPDEVLMEGTLRTLDENWRKKAHQIILDTAQNVGQSMGGVIEVDIVKGYPCLVNDAEMAKSIKSAMQSYLGPDNVIDLDIRMTAEDFAFYSQVIPACFYRLGTANESSATQHSVHTPYFDIDAQALEVGMGLMAFLAFHAK